MSAFLIAVAVFLCLAAASLGSMLLHRGLPERYRDDDTNTVVRLVANLFVVITSLSFGLLINSAKNNFDAIDRNVHGLATNLVQLDHMLRSYGPEAETARAGLRAFAKEAIAHPAGVEDGSAETSSRSLDGLFEALAAIAPPDARRVQLLDGMHERYHRIAELRWTILEQADGSLPGAIVVLLAAWLTLIFLSYGYRAPRNAVIVTTFLLAAFLIAASIYLVLDMEVPFSGPIQVSDAPLHRALAEISR